MRPSLRAACVGALCGLCACGGGASTASSAGGSTATTSTSSSGGGSAQTPGGGLEITPEPGASPSTPTPVADPCALIPTTTLLNEFHTDSASSRVDAEKQSVSGSQGCIYDISGAADVEVILTLVPASQVDTSSGGGLTIAGHPAASRQTEGGAAEIDVVVSSTDAFTLSVDIGGGTASPDSEKQPAQDLATVVAGAYH